MHIEDRMTKEKKITKIHTSFKEFSKFSLKLVKRINKYEKTANKNLNSVNTIGKNVKIDENFSMITIKFSKNNFYF